MFILIFPVRKQILPYLLQIQELKRPFIWATDGPVTTTMINHGDIQSVPKVIAYPGIEGIRDYLDGPVFQGAQITWITAPDEEIELPELSGRVCKRIDTSMTAEQFCSYVL